MALKTTALPFGLGLNQADDDRMLAPGTPRSIENLIVLKNGRLGMRLDYDALASGLRFGTNLQLFDLANLSDRLLGFGCLDDASNNAVVPTKGIVQAFEYLATPYAWAALPQPTMSAVQHVRNVGSIPLQTSSVSNVDVAAGLGFVCAVWQIVDSGVTTVIAAIFNATTGALIRDTFFPNQALPRVVFLGTGFWVAATSLTTNAVTLANFDVITGIFAPLTAPDGASANAVIALDMSLDRETTSFWIAFGRVGATTRFYKYNSAGAQLVNNAGPAVLITAITVFAEQVTGGQQRMHLALVLSATTRCRMVTYLIPALTIETDTADQFAIDVHSQVGLCMRESLAGNVIALFQDVGVFCQLTSFVNNTHAAGALQSLSGTLNSKLLSARDHPFYAVTLREGASASTNELATIDPNFIDKYPSCSIDRLIAGGANQTQLPNLAQDASSKKLYWARLVNQSLNKATPLIAESFPISTDRRQTTQLGNVLYVAGGAVQSVDGTSVVEAGGFLRRPFIIAIGQSAGGSLTALATYQVVAVFEVFDALNNRIQSAPSDVTTVTLTGGNQTLNVNIDSLGLDTFWRSVSQFSVGRNLMGKAVAAFYRTLPSAAGNITFYRDPATGSALTASDAVLATGEVLYSQGARGSLSGPLPFVTPQPCINITSSADRVYAGGLPDSSTTQESRPQFPAEQANWSDSIAFLREARGAVLAVARLDERRLVFTATEIFELSGEGVDDNGNGDIGAARRLPSDVGLFGGILGWRSLVEFQGGLMFQGLSNQLYLLPRGGVAPTPVGLTVQDKLAAFPTITAAVYIAGDKTIRFACNNVGLTDSIILLYDVTHNAWTFEGPFGVPTASMARLQDRLVLLQSNVVKQRRASHPPAALIANAWRSGTIHPFGLGGWGRVNNFQFYGEYQGDCALRAIARFDDLVTETLTTYEINAFSFVDFGDATGTNLPASKQVTLATGDPVSFKFTANQLKCESFRLDFEVDVPFPSVVGFASASRGTLGTTLAITLPTTKLAGDRAIVCINLQAQSAVTPPAGWNSLLQTNLGVGTVQRFCVFERIFDGSEPAAVTFTWSTSTGAFATLHLVRNSHATAPSELSFSTGTGTAVTTPTLAPSWGVLNTLWLSTVSLTQRLVNPVGGNIIVQPPGFSRFVNSSAVNVDPNLDGQIETGVRALRIATFPSVSWGWQSASDVVGLILAIRPSASLPSAGLAYHYWTYDSEASEGSARHAPTQMG